MRNSSFFYSMVFAFFCYSVPASAVFINEIHYDNSGADVGEAIELAGAAGTDLAGWHLLLYNGTNGLVYDTIALSGVIGDLQNGFGVLNFAAAGIQNGVSDGIALVDGANAVVQFLSYEGVVTALNGIANGMSSVDIGVIESGSSSPGFSLQLSGTGSDYGDFTWTAPSTQTAGAVNTSQRFLAQTTAVPAPSGFALLLLGIFLWRLKNDDRLTATAGGDTNSLPV